MGEFSASQDVQTVKFSSLNPSKHGQMLNWSDVNSPFPVSVMDERFHRTSPTTIGKSPEDGCSQVVFAPVCLTNRNVESMASFHRWSEESWCLDCIYKKMWTLSCKKSCWANVNPLLKCRQVRVSCCRCCVVEERKAIWCTRRRPTWEKLIQQPLITTWRK